MISDVLVLTVPLRPMMRYPSANSSLATSLAYGSKSDEYKALAFDVEEAASAAVAAGWETVVYPCRAWITRYAPDARVRDALNLGQCEANALTRAGVWSDDELARPITLDVQPRSDGPDRIVIMVQRIAAPIGVEPRQNRSRPKAEPKPIVGVARGASVVGYRPGDPIPAGYALLGTELITTDEAMRRIRGEKEIVAPSPRRRGARR